MDIFRDDGVIERNRQLAKTMAEQAERFRGHPHVAEVRQTGMIVAIELVQDKARRIPYPWQQRRGLKVFEHALRQGVLLRPLGNVIYFMPPYVITPEQISWMMDVAWQGIEQAVGG